MKNRVLTQTLADFSKSTESIILGAQLSKRITIIKASGLLRFLKSCLISILVPGDIIIKISAKIEAIAITVGLEQTRGTEAPIKIAAKNENIFWSPIPSVKSRSSALLLNLCALKKGMF